MHFLRHMSGMADRAETRIPTEAGMTEHERKGLEELLKKILKPTAGAVWIAIDKMCEPDSFAELQAFFRSTQEPPDGESGK